MANDLNRHECIGRLGKDPETKFMQSGEAVTNISVACGKNWKDKQTGQKQERTTWINYTAFGKLAEIIDKYLKKGSRVYLSGELRVRKWQAQDGSDRYSTEIVASEMQMLDSRGDVGSGAGGSQLSVSGDGGHQPAMPPNNFDDDIPF